MIVEARNRGAISESPVRSCPYLCRGVLPKPHEPHKEVVRCILLCAGRGIQLKPFTDGKPKAYIPVQDTPLIVHALKTLKKATPFISDFTIVTGCFHEFWEDHLHELKEEVAPIGVTLLNNPAHDTTGPAKSLQFVISSWGASTYDRVCVVYGDILFTELVVQRLFDVPVPAIAVDREFRRSKPMFGDDCIEFVTLNEDRVATIGTKANKEVAFGEYIGICLLCKETLTNFTWIRDDTTMAEFLQDVARNFKMSAVSFVGNWKEVNTYDDLIAAHADIYFLPNESARKKYVADIGRRLLSEANNIKRPLELVAYEMGLEDTVLPSIVDGTMNVDTAQQLLSRVSRHYPVAMENLWVEPEDTYHGTLMMSSNASEASSRVLTRPNAQGVEEEYYEYRDTAMSRLAPFRPEYIKMLRVVHDDDPCNPNVVYNKGHLLLQVTFFVGPVNFYYIKPNGEKVCERMNTGDSNWIASFVPHTFTRRGDGEEPAYIIAVTYGALIILALSSLNRLRRRINADFKSRLRRYMEVELLCTEELLSMVNERAREVVNGERECEWPDAVEIAKALNCKPEDLMITPVPAGETVVAKKSDADVLRYFPHNEKTRYIIRKCARQVHQPLVKAFDLEVKPPGGAVMDISLHQYVFNYSEHPCVIECDEVTQPLDPKGSVYIQPTVRWRLWSEHPAKVFIVGIPGHLTSDTLAEVGLCEPGGIERIGAEHTRWY